MLPELFMATAYRAGCVFWLFVQVVFGSEEAVCGGLPGKPYAVVRKSSDTKN